MGHAKTVRKNPSKTLKWIEKNRITNSITIEDRIGSSRKKEQCLRQFGNMHKQASIGDVCDKYMYVHVNARLLDLLPALPQHNYSV